MDIEGVNQCGRNRAGEDQLPSAAEVGRQLARIFAGERRGAAWLYDTFAPRLYRRLRGRYGHPGGLDADDLLHDAFVFYLRHRAKVLRDFSERVPDPEQTPERLERHLWNLACGVAANARRFSARRESEPLDPSLARDSDEDRVLARDQLRRLDRCLAGGNTRVYLYYKLRYWDGRDPKEIAAMTGWSMKTTYKLRQKLDEAVRSCAERLGLEPPSSGA